MRWKSVQDITLTFPQNLEKTISNLVILLFHDFKYHHFALQILLEMCHKTSDFIVFYHFAKYNYYCILPQCIFAKCILTLAKLPSAFLHSAFLHQHPDSQLLLLQPPSSRRVRVQVCSISVLLGPKLPAESGSATWHHLQLPTTTAAAARRINQETDDDEQKKEKNWNSFRGGSSQCCPVSKAKNSTVGPLQYNIQQEEMKTL